MPFTIKINGLELEVYDGDQLVFRSVSRAKVYRFVFESGIRDSAPQGHYATGPPRRADFRVRHGPRHLRYTGNPTMEHRLLQQAPDHR